MDADLVLFTDDILNHDMDRVSRLCDLIMERGIRKGYVANARIEISARMDVVRKMEKAGFVALLLGIESAQDRTLRSLAEGFDTAKIESCFGILRHTRMLLHGYFILGCIGETEEDMLAIAPFARRLGLDTVGLSALRTVPFDGLRQLVTDTPGYHISSEGFVYSDLISREQLRDIQRAIWRRFSRRGMSPAPGLEAPARPDGHPGSPGPAPGGRGQGGAWPGAGASARAGSGSSAKAEDRGRPAMGVGGARRWRRVGVLLVSGLAPFVVGVVVQNAVPGLRAE